MRKTGPRERWVAAKLTGSKVKSTSGGESIERNQFDRLMWAVVKMTGSAEPDGVVAKDIRIVVAQLEWDIIKSALTQRFYSRAAP